MDFSGKKAVLFDLDGTLIDTLKDIAAGLNYSLTCLGYPPCTIEQARTYIGHASRALMRQALPQSAGEEGISRALDLYVPYYIENCTVRSVRFPGARDFCRFLHAHGVRIGMITNKTQPIAEKVMAHYFGDVPFELIWGNDGKRKLKPDPESGKLACEALAVAPSDVVFVGDGDTDMAFAVKCGFTACGVSWGYRSPEVLREYGADVVVHSFEELQAMF